MGIDVVLQIMIDVAGLYLMTGDLDACQHQLMTLLKNDKENDTATIVCTTVNPVTHNNR